MRTVDVAILLFEVWGGKEACLSIPPPPPGLSAGISCAPGIWKPISWRCELGAAPSPALDHFPCSLPPSSLQMYFLCCFLLGPQWLRSPKTLSFEDQRGLAAYDRGCSSSGTTPIILLCLLQRLLGWPHLILRVFVWPLCQSPQEWPWLSDHRNTVPCQTVITRKYPI